MHQKNTPPNGIIRRFFYPLPTDFEEISDKLICENA